MGYIPPWIVHIYTHSKMKMFVVLALVAAAAAEPEADPALVYTTGLHGLHAPLTYAAGLPLAHHTYAGVPVVGVKSAVVKSVVEKPADVKVETTPITYTVPAVHHPVVYDTAVHHPVVYNAAVAPVVAPVASHTITNYNNPEQYTAVSNGVFGPSYVAKNGPVEHIVKREAEADPALLYSTYGYPTYAGVYGAGVYGAGVYGLHHAGVYAAAPAVVANPLVKTPDHAVAATAFGYTHSSNVGICTNVNGVQVPC